MLGFAAAGLLAPVASAWNWDGLPSGYSVRVASGDPTCVGGRVVRVNGHLIGCTNDSGFQSALDNYINSTICTVNPSADPGLCPPTTTTTTAQTTTTTPTTTTTAAAPVSGGTSGGTSTVTVTDPRVDTLQTQVTNLQAAVAAIQTQLTKLIQILEQWPGIDPAILSQLQTL